PRTQPATCGGRLLPGHAAIVEVERRPPAAVRGAATLGEGDVAQLHATAVEFEVAALQVAAAQLRVDHHVAAQVDPGHRQSRATALDAQGAVADIAVAFDLQVA